jgi:hypothetical protein
MAPAIRKVGIAIGSLVAAWLVVWLVGSLLPVPFAGGLLTIVLGGLIYRDISRR